MGFAGQAVLDHEGGNALRGEPLGRVVALVAHPKLAVASPGDDEHRHPGAGGGRGQKGGEGGLLHVRHDPLALLREAHRIRRGGARGARGPAGPEQDFGRDGPRGSRRARGVPRGSRLAGPGQRSGCGRLANARAGGQQEHSQKRTEAQKVEHGQVSRWAGKGAAKLAAPTHIFRQLAAVPSGQGQGGSRAFPGRGGPGPGQSGPGSSAVKRRQMRVAQGVPVAAVAQVARGTAPRHSPCRVKSAYKPAKKLVNAP